MSDSGAVVVESRELVDKFRIFVSYSSSDLGPVDKLKAMLSESHVEVFIAEYSVQGGESLPHKVKDAIAECDQFVLLWGENTLRSDWVKIELGQAVALEKPILPVRLSKVDMPPYLGDLKYIDATENTEAALMEAAEIIVERARVAAPDLFGSDLAVRSAEHPKQRSPRDLLLVGIVLLLGWALMRE